MKFECKNIISHYAMIKDFNAFNYSSTKYKVPSIVCKYQRNIRKTENHKLEYEW